MKEIIGMNEEATVEISLSEYRALQQMSGRVSALVELIEADSSSFADINSVLRILGYGDFACDREIAKAKKEAATKEIEVPL